MRGKIILVYFSTLLLLQSACSVCIGVGNSCDSPSTSEPSPTGETQVGIVSSQTSDNTLMPNLQIEATPTPTNTQTWTPVPSPTFTGIPRRDPTETSTPTLTDTPTFTLTATRTPTHTPTPTVFYIYSDANAPQIFIPSGYMGDGDIEVIENWTVEPYSGTSAIRIVYDPQGRPLDDGYHRCQMGLPTTTVCGWVGLYWLYPADNQGIVPGYDLSASGCNRIIFWARSETPLSIRFIVGGIGWGIPTQPAYPDSLRDPRSTGWVQLNSEWAMYTIDLSGADLSSIAGGFGFVTNLDNNQAEIGDPPFVFYLDEIRCEP